MQTESGNIWRSALAGWAIPEQILNQAPENPWIHPTALFQIPEVIEDTPSHRLAREALPVDGKVLDVGCGRGIAAFALVPPAGHVIGVDHQPEMLSMFSEKARKGMVLSETFLGFWPEVSANAPIADVVTTHHVVYNVQEIEDFLIALDSYALNRVVIEMPQLHPFANSSSLWKHFWNLERPSTPTPSFLMAVLQELGFKANVELWEGKMRQEQDLQELAHYSRIRLCLPEEREHEVLQFLQSQTRESVRKLATIWWDKN